MALRNVLTEGDDRLRKKSRPVTEFNARLRDLLDDMYDTMQKSNGVGIAGPQVGILRRVAVVDIGEGRWDLVNPVLLEQEGDQLGCEGCLSVPGEYGMVHRPQKIKLTAQDKDGKSFTLTAEDYLAVAVSHELDHLEGVLFTDKAERMLTEEELEEQTNAQ